MKYSVITKALFLSATLWSLTSTLHAVAPAKPIIDPKVEFRDRCIKCHEPAAVLFGGKLKTKDLRKTIYDMYRVDSSDKPSKAQVDSMLKYAKSLKKN